MRLWAIADLHLGAAENRRALEDLPWFPEDDLILAGDTGEREEHLELALDLLVPRFRRLYWVPGNHDLWSARGADGDRLRGVAKYERLVEICRAREVLTPEDPYRSWPGGEGGGADGDAHVIAPLFLLYDYSFRPDHIRAEDAVAWAAETGVLCNDEIVLRPDPYPSREAWCEERLRITEERLRAVAAGGRRLVLVNHFPLRRRHAVLPRIPRFSLWCGTRATDDWHRRFPVDVVVYGHLHIRITHLDGGVRFEEVSLGYPRDWDRSLGVRAYLRQILPDPRGPAGPNFAKDCGMAGPLVKPFQGLGSWGRSNNTAGAQRRWVTSQEATT